MNLAELKALNLVSSNATVDTDLGGGRILTQHSAGAKNYIRFVVRRYRSIREQFLAAPRMMKAASMSNGEPAMGDIMDWEANATAALEDRIEADVTLIALTLTRPRTLADLKPFEDEILDWPQEVFRAARKGALDVTYGEDPSVFFGEVRSLMNGFDLFMTSLPGEEMLIDSSPRTAA